MVSAVGKLAAQSGQPLTRDAAALLEGASRAESVELQQRALELQALLRASAATQRAALPYDAAAEDVGVDPGLLFLEGFVQQVRREGRARVRSQELVLCALTGEPWERELRARDCVVLAGGHEYGSGAVEPKHQPGMSAGHAPEPLPSARAASLLTHRRCKTARPPTSAWRTGWRWA